MSSMMTDFAFDVDEEFARKHNEFFRDARRLQVAAGLLAALLIVGVVAMFLIGGVQLTTVAVGFIMGFFALMCLVIIPVLPKKMGDPQHYYNMYKLAPAVVAQVNPRDIVVLSLVDASSDASAPARPALAARTVTSIPGVPREVGARVPSMAVTGAQTLRSKGVFEEISPMPVAWGTQDQQVLEAAQRAIPQRQWSQLESSVGRIDEVLATRRNLLLLES